jgi:hypothetical protein
MAGKAKSIYLTVLPRGSFISCFKKVFFDAKAYNEFIKSEEFKTQFPKEQYDIVREVY